MIMSNPGEISVLTKWLEERLKEHFAKKSRGRKFMKDDDYEWLLSAAANKSNGIPIHTAIFDFRILDLKLESEPELQIRDNNLFKEHINEDGNPDAVPNDGPCKHRNSYVWLVYQEGSQCVGKELRLHMHASQFELLKTYSAVEGRLTSPKSYILSLDEHQIDVYTKVFPILKEWASSKNAGISLPVPECYYGCYESEEVLAESPLTENNDKEDEIIIAEDDIMSKIAAGMEILEKEKKIKAHIRACNPPMKQSGSRLLILDDTCSEGYMPRNVMDSTFLSLMNVREALKSLAAIHSTSWAFSKLTGRSLQKIWPFLKNDSYLAFICDRVVCGYPVMVGLVREYLSNRNGQQTTKEDQVPRILESLMKLETRLVAILEGAENPSTTQCLIHQDARFSTFLFRYDVLRNQKRIGESGQADEDNKKLRGAGQSSSIEPTKTRWLSLDSGLKRDVMLINWRTASVGSPMIDVAFLLMTALPPKTRRAETRSLLSVYWNCFKMHARKFDLSFEYSEDEMFQEYFAALLYSCVLITGNVEIGSKLGDEGIEVFVEAVKDLIREGLM